MVKLLKGFPGKVEVGVWEAAEVEVGVWHGKTPAPDFHPRRWLIVREYSQE